jgi:hypothetical protein
MTVDLMLSEAAEAAVKVKIKNNTVPNRVLFLFPFPFLHACRLPDRTLPLSVLHVGERAGRFEIATAG